MLPAGRITGKQTYDGIEPDADQKDTRMYKLSYTIHHRDAVKIKSVFGKKIRPTIDLSNLPF